MDNGLGDNIFFRRFVDGTTPKNNLSKMLKLTCLLLCVVAASLTKVNAISEEEKNAFREAIAPVIAECSAEHGVTEEDIQAAKEAKNPDGIKSCFLGCVMKKTEVLDSKGFYDAEKGLGKLKKFVKNDEDFAKFEEIGKICSKVNDEPVSDGDAGCDRAKLVLACALENKADMPF